MFVPSNMVCFKIDQKMTKKPWKVFIKSFDSKNGIGLLYGIGLIYGLLYGIEAQSTKK